MRRLLAEEWRWVVLGVAVGLILIGLAAWWVPEPDLII